MDRSRSQTGVTSVHLRCRLVVPGLPAPALLVLLPVSPKERGGQKAAPAIFKGSGSEPGDLLPATSYRSAHQCFACTWLGRIADRCGTIASSHGQRAHQPPPRGDGDDGSSFRRSARRSDPDPHGRPARSRPARSCRRPDGFPGQVGAAIKHPVRGEASNWHCSACTRSAYCSKINSNL